MRVSLNHPSVNEGDHTSRATSCQRIGRTTRRSVPAYPAHLLKRFDDPILAPPCGTRKRIVTLQ